jgi:hypothetical protein
MPLVVRYLRHEQLHCGHWWLPRTPPRAKRFRRLCLRGRLEQEKHPMLQEKDCGPDNTVNGVVALQKKYEKNCNQIV